MTVLIGQILGCLLVAAGIGGVIGWLLRHLSVRQLLQQFRDVTATLRLKGQMLEKAQYELKVQAAAMQMLESKLIESEALDQSTRQELSAQNDRLQALQQELAVRIQRLMSWKQKKPLFTAARASMMRPPLHRRKKSSNFTSHARPPNRHSSLKSKNG